MTNELSFLPENSFLEFVTLLQEQLANEVNLNSLPCSKIKNISAVDVAYDSERSVAAAVIWNIRTRRVIEEVTCSDRVVFPYIPGFLALREGPAALKALRRVKHKVDLILFDGHGIAHPRAAGLATTMGILLHCPTIGIAKRLLVGEFSKDLPISPIRLNDKKVGYSFALGSNRRFYVSPGNMCSIEDIPRVMSLIGPNYPAVMRLADSAARKGLKGLENRTDSNIT